MKKEYDFSKGRRGALEPLPPGKIRITIRLDNEIIEWFRGKAEEQGGGNYQSMINRALREYIDNRAKSLEVMIRRVIKEELEKLFLNKSTVLDKAVSENSGIDSRAFRKNPAK